MVVHHLLMDNRDPDQRLAELERLVAEARQRAGLQASPHHGGGPRRFVASPPHFGARYDPKKGMWIGYAGLALFFVPLFMFTLVGQSDSPFYDAVSVAIRPLFFLLAMLVLGGLTALYWRHQHKKIYIDVSSDGLRVSTRPGEVFSLRDAQLGPWSFWQSMGSALHLRCGPKTFVLGGRDHRLSSGSAAPTKDVDAWLWAADFDALLSMAGIPGPGDEQRLTAGPPDVDAPAADGRTRCALFPNPEMVSLQPIWAPWRVRRMANSFLEPRQPSLAIDVGPDDIRVVDPATNVVQASARLAQVTAAPEFYLLLRPYIFMWFYRFFPYAYLKNLQWTSPVLVLSAPGLAPLSIGCRDVSGKDHLFVLTQMVVNRFSWRDKMPMRINRPADWSVSAADWLLLVEIFGLTPYLEDTTNQGWR